MSIKIHLEICDRVLSRPKVHFLLSVQKNILKKQMHYAKNRSCRWELRTRGRKRTVELKRIYIHIYRKWEDIERICISFCIFRTTLSLLRFVSHPALQNLLRQPLACENRRCAEKYKFPSRFHICSRYTRSLVLLLRDSVCNSLVLMKMRRK